MSNLVRTIIVMAVFVAQYSLLASQLSDAAKDFIDAHDDLQRSRGEVAEGRVQLAANHDNQERLEDVVREWFNDRADVADFAVEKAEERGDLLEALNFQGAPAAKVTKPTRNLQQDAQSFITHYDSWLQLDQTVAANTEQIRAALNSGDEALRQAANTFFTNRRARNAARRQWQSDLRSLVKILKFKSTEKAAKPPGDSLKEHTAEFLSDRAAWVASGEQIKADLNNLRATVNSSSLEASVRSLLTQRARRSVLAKELALDRRAMRARNGLKSAEATLKDVFSGNSPSEDHVDEEDAELEQSPSFL